MLTIQTSQFAGDNNDARLEIAVINACGKTVTTNFFLCDEGKKWCLMSAFPDYSNEFNLDAIQGCDVKIVVQDHLYRYSVDTKKCDVRRSSLADKLISQLNWS